MYEKLRHVNISKQNLTSCIKMIAKANHISRFMKYIVWLSVEPRTTARWLKSGPSLINVRTSRYVNTKKHGCHFANDLYKFIFL